MPRFSLLAWVFVAAACATLVVSDAAPAHAAPRPGTPAGSPAEKDDGLTAQAIIDRALERNPFGFRNAKAQVTLKLYDPAGNQRLRQLEVRSHEQDGLGRMLVRFHAPSDVAGTGFLVREAQGRDNEQYLYLPAFGRVRRVTGRQRQQRFMGTDFTYADLESRDLNDAVLTRLPDAITGSQPAYVIEAIPSDPKKSEYGKLITWVHTKSYVPLKTEFYDRKGTLLKVLTVKRLDKKDGHWIATDSLLKHVQRGSRTRMQIGGIDFNDKQRAADFTKQALAGS